MNTDIYTELSAIESVQHTSSSCCSCSAFFSVFFSPSFRKRSQVLADIYTLLLLLLLCLCLCCCLCWRRCCLGYASVLQLGLRNGFGLCDWGALSHFYALAGLECGLPRYTNKSLSLCFRFRYVYAVLAELPKA